jgi:periplasmic divalent cation tolerance protein
MPKPPNDPAAVRIVLSTAPPGVAHDLARRLVDERLAACVNVVPGLRSVYRFEGAVHDDPESLLWIKTTEGLLGALGERLEALHPYRLPERLVLRPEGGSEAYRAWVAGEVGPTGPGSATSPP